MCKRVANITCAGKAAAFPETEACHSDESQAAVVHPARIAIARSGACINVPFTVRNLVRFALSFSLSLHVFHYLDCFEPFEDSSQDSVDLLVRELVWRDILFHHSFVSAETVSAGVAIQFGFILFQLPQALLTHLQILLSLLAFSLQLFKIFLRAM